MVAAIIQGVYRVIDGPIQGGETSVKDVTQWDEHRCSYWRLATYGHK
jgi:hypothetical protein